MCSVRTVEMHGFEFGFRISEEEIAGRVFLTISDDEWKEDYGIKRGADRRMLTSLQEEVTIAKT